MPSVQLKRAFISYWYFPAAAVSIVSDVASCWLLYHVALSFSHHQLLHQCRVTGGNPHCRTMRSGNHGDSPANWRFLLTCDTEQFSIYAKCSTLPPCLGAAPTSSCSPANNEKHPPPAFHLAASRTLRSTRMIHFDRFPQTRFHSRLSPDTVDALVRALSP